MAVRYEVVGLAAKRLEAAASDWTKRSFNASPAYIDGAGVPRPYLAEALPQLNTASWTVTRASGKAMSVRIERMVAATISSIRVKPRALLAIDLF